MNRTQPIRVYNKRAHFDYEIDQIFEVGIALEGSEIKAIRSKNVKLDGSYVRVQDGNLIWLGANFGKYSDKDNRTIRLLAKRPEINKIIGLVSRQKMTAVPINLHMKRGYAKLDIGIGRGRKKVDKREIIRKREIERETAIAERLKVR